MQSIENSFLEKSEILVHSPVHLVSRSNTFYNQDKPNKPDVLAHSSANFFKDIGQESFRSYVHPQAGILPKFGKKQTGRPPLRGLLDNGTQAPNQWIINSHIYNREVLNSYILTENYRRRIFFETEQKKEAYCRQRILFNHFKSRKEFVSPKRQTTTSLPNLIINFNKPKD